MPAHLVRAVFLVALLVIAGAAPAVAQPFRLLAAFEEGPRRPTGRLLQVDAGWFYGVTAEGGRYQQGTVFLLYQQAGGAWDLVTLHSFNGADGRHPIRGLTLGGDGRLYGITAEGGANDQGTIFTIGLLGGLSTVHSFPPRATPNTNLQPFATLVRGTDGNLWGSICRRLDDTHEGNGRIFKLSPSGAVTTVVQFPDDTCAASLVEASDGHFYGTTSRDIFRLTKGGAIASLESVQHYPVGDLVLGSDGNVYGTALPGSYPIFGNAAEIFFGLSPATGDFTLYTLQHDELPSGLVEGTPGVFYSTRARGDVVRVVPSEGSVTVIGQLDRNAAGDRRDQMVRGRDGRFYGLSGEGTSPDFYGLKRGKGTAFALTEAGAASQLFGFDREGPLTIAGALLEGDSALIGASCFGGPYDRGTVFTLGAAGISLLHGFGPDDGACPTGLVRGADGSVFGSTLDGTVFRLAPDGGFTVLHRLAGSTRGTADTLTIGSDGNLWGNWFDFEPLVFRITTDGEMTRLPLPSGVGQPAGGLVQATDGHFYGMAFNGSQTSVFRVTLGGQIAVVVASPDIKGLFGRFVQAGDGNLYASSIAGYAVGPPLTPVAGAVFSVSLAGSIARVHEFTPQEGYSPLGELVEVTNGVLAGVTFGGRNVASAPGSVFAVGSSGTFRMLHQFSGADGANPYAPLLRGSDGALYGSTLFGGPGGAGVIFRIQP